MHGNYITAVLVWIFFFLDKVIVCIWYPISKKKKKKNDIKLIFLTITLSTKEVVDQVFSIKDTLTHILIQHSYEK